MYVRIIPTTLVCLLFSTAIPTFNFQFKVVIFLYLSLFIFLIILHNFNGFIDNINVCTFR